MLINIYYLFHIIIRLYINIFPILNMNLCITFYFAILLNLYVAYLNTNIRKHSKKNNKFIKNTNKINYNKVSFKLYIYIFIKYLIFIYIDISFHFIYYLFKNSFPIKIRIQHIRSIWGKE